MIKYSHNELKRWVREGSQHGMIVTQQWYDYYTQATAFIGRLFTQVVIIILESGLEHSGNGQGAPLEPNQSVIVFSYKQVAPLEPSVFRKVVLPQGGILFIEL